MLEFTGWMALGLAALVASINFYLSFIRYPIHKLIGSGEWRWVSGIPVVGTGCLLVAIGCLRSHPWLLPAAVLIAAIDTGGVPWFFLVMLWAVFSDEPNPPDADGERPCQK